MVEDVYDQAKLLFQHIRNSLFGLSAKKKSCYYFARSCITGSRNHRSCLIPGSLPVPIILLAEWNNKMQFSTSKEKDSVYTWIHTDCLSLDQSNIQVLVPLYDLQYIRIWMCCGLFVGIRDHLTRPNHAGIANFEDRTRNGFLRTTFHNIRG